MNDLSKVLRGLFPYPSRSGPLGGGFVAVTVCKAPLTYRERSQTGPVGNRFATQQREACAKTSSESESDANRREMKSRMSP
jgi:hypothetical protein